MATPRARYQSKIVESIKRIPEMRECDLVVFDIGASGGLDNFWRQWEPNLSAYCFDPIVTEIERLAVAETNPRIVYHTAWLSCDDYTAIKHEIERTRSNRCFKFVSAQRAQSAISLTYQEKYYNQGQLIIEAKERTTIDRFCQKQGIEDIDFIKTDTDGHDYFVLRGAEETLERRNVLGLLVECDFHGSIHDHANGFSNIDRLLRNHGFTLFDIDIHRYTRAALPGPFVYDIPAQTIDGQVQWGDALYLRDPVIDPSFLTALPSTRRLTKALKLLGLYESFGLPDCAAGLLLHCKESDTLWTGIDSEVILDSLVPINPFGINSYRAYIDFFDADPAQFYPSNYKRAGRRPLRALETFLRRKLRGIGHDPKRQSKS